MIQVSDFSGILLHFISAGCIIFPLQRRTTKSDCTGGTDIL